MNFIAVAAAVLTQLASFGRGPASRPVEGFVSFYLQASHIGLSPERTESKEAVGALIERPSFPKENKDRNAVGHQIVNICIKYFRSDFLVCGIIYLVIFWRLLT
ncbi:MAG: hypothetical protein IJK24_00405 [Oscillospiraceae bacterium]|nr:hypothetical protein [Oscillospiraceae bacterium]